MGTFNSDRSIGQRRNRQRSVRSFVVGKSHEHLPMVPSCCYQRWIVHQRDQKEPSEAQRRSPTLFGALLLVDEQKLFFSSPFVQDCHVDDLCEGDEDGMGVHGFHVDVGRVRGIAIVELLEISPEEIGRAHV